MAHHRAFFKLKVKEGHEAEYSERHKAVWPEVEGDLALSGVLEMTIW